MPIPLRSSFPLIVLAVVAIVIAGCGSSDDGGGSTSSGTSRSKDAATSTAKRDTSGEDGRFEVTYKGKVPTVGKALRKGGALEKVADDLSDRIELPRDVTIVMGGDDEGPYYDPETVTIQYPWSFVEDTERLLGAAGYDESDITQGIEDATAFILTHELGHALIDQLDLPVLGREEDAADSFASFVAVDYLDDGELVIAASDLFAAYADEDGTDEDEAAFFDSHSLDLQRFYTISCDVYGADTERYEEVVEGIGISDERLDECPEEYGLISESWNDVLGPNLRDE